MNTAIITKGNHISYSVMAGKMKIVTTRLQRNIYGHTYDTYAKEVNRE